MLTFQSMTEVRAFALYLSQKIKRPIACSGYHLEFYQTQDEIGQPVGFIIRVPYRFGDD